MDDDRGVYLILHVLRTISRKAENLNLRWGRMSSVVLTTT